VLLARAAAYATHREFFSTLFNIESMEPLIAGPPFVRALEQLAAAAALGPEEQAEYTPGDVRTAFWQEQTAMGLTWPTAAAEIAAATDKISVGFAELPGSMEIYNFADQTWEKRLGDQDAQVPLLSSSGRLGMVAADCRWPQAGFQLLFWLSGDDLSRQVSTRSAATTLFRASHLQSPRQWVEKPVSASAAAEYSVLAQQAFSRPRGLFALRLPGRSTYLAALDDAVHDVLSGKSDAEEALQRAASQWETITDGQGREVQQRAYLHSLGQE
jgi:multiple sugar transport system substrate-binding protein